MNSQQRLVLTISILASFVAFLDGSVVNVALPAISRELGGGLAAIALIGLVVGQQLDLAGFHRGVLVTAGLLLAGGIISAIGIQNAATPAEAPAKDTAAAH